MLNGEEYIWNSRSVNFEYHLSDFGSKVTHSFVLESTTTRARNCEGEVLTYHFRDAEYQYYRDTKEGTAILAQNKALYTETWGKSAEKDDFETYKLASELK